MRPLIQPRTPRGVETRVWARHLLSLGEPANAVARFSSLARGQDPPNLASQELGLKLVAGKGLSGEACSSRDGVGTPYLLPSLTALFLSRSEISGGPSSFISSGVFPALLQGYRRKRSFKLGRSMSSFVSSQPATVYNMTTWAYMSVRWTSKLRTWFYFTFSIWSYGLATCSSRYVRKVSWEIKAEPLLSPSHNSRDLIITSFYQSLIPNSANTRPNPTNNECTE